jgi:hypothetical protein
MRTNMIQKSTRRSLLVLLTVLFLLLPSSLWAIADKGAGRIDPPATLLESRTWQSENLISRKKGPSYESDEGFYESLSPEDKARMKNRSKKWESLPPEKRRELERRMNQWKALPPEEKDLMRKRHQQWQELPPGERDRIREKLNRWESLTPQEQDEIRKKFKRP